VAALLHLSHGFLASRFDLGAILAQCRGVSMRWVFFGGEKSLTRRRYGEGGRAA
jgi:hypothetical protein